MRILLCAEGTRGDVHPLLALGSALADAGHTIRVCAPPVFADAVALRGFEFRSSGLDVVDMIESNAAAIVGAGARLVLAHHRLGNQLLAQGFGATVEAAQDCDFILAAGVQFAAATAAELHGVPYRYVMFTPALLPSDEHAPALLPNPLPRWATRLAWRALPTLMTPIVRHIARDRARYGLGPPGDPFDYVIGPRPALLAADAELVGSPRYHRHRVVTIGALQDDAHASLPEKLERFLEAGPPPVYIGFGSMSDPAPEETSARLIEALQIAGARGVISSGWAGLGSVALPEDVMQVGDVSHTTLFPRCAAVVHHGGAGTTTRAARAGVPQVVVPHLLDQHDFARRVHAAGLSPPPLRRRGLRGDALGAAIRGALDNVLGAERARRLGERLRDADPLRPENREPLLERVLAS